ncbi:MvdC/MvdD family ATP grasp protein [Paracoccus sp. NSM]|uniref:MvdC/MvdD family ATP grasp protein n=1 Tax=Paracoccus sp. NSM TaxID=3457784 RepID=UPI004036D216
MILIISHPDDIHARTVIDHLDRLGAESQILNLARFPRAARLVLRYGPTGSQLGFSDDEGRLIDLDRVGAAWWRRPQPLEFEPGLQAQDFAAAECAEALAGLWLAMPATWINPPVEDEAASRKSWQLRLAGQLGLDPPETLVTTCAETARAFVAQHGDVICKPFSGSLRYWRETRRIGEAELAQLGQLRHAPAILQRRIEGRDLRVTVVGRKVFAAEIDTSGGSYADDFRMNQDVTIRPTALPPAMIDAIHALMARLGLVYGALDFRRQPDGRLRFLEINPAGQFLFVEEQTGQPIARAMAEALLALDRDHGATPTAPEGPGWPVGLQAVRRPADHHL